MKKALILAVFMSFNINSYVFASNGYVYDGAGYQNNGTGYQYNGAGYQYTGAGYQYTGAGYQYTGAGYHYTGTEIKNNNQQKSDAQNSPGLQNKLQQTDQVEQLTKQGQEWLDSHSDEAKQIQQYIEQQSQQHSK